ncbi:DNA polymerase III subunit alpha [Aestuariirhabdus sp. LZHN29]|uniref:DNA polymerase III subunit alpha n=1 Tax=Aestuariirhabdus sp. LZHN29 TaxID=3417462 RepID=UPI003CF5891F
MSSQFVHLRLHTEYSLVDGLVRLKPLLGAVASKGMPAVAMTDQSNLFALVKFYTGAMGAGIKPICGADMWVENLDPLLPPTRILLLIVNAEGYRNLTELISRGFQHGQKQGVAIVQREWIKQASEGLIALCGGRQGEIGQALLAGNTGDAEQLLQEWREVFGDRFYLEVQRTSRAGDEDHLHHAVTLAERTGCPLVATNDVMFLEKTDYEAHETRVCIGEGRALDDPRRPRLYSEEQYLKSPQEMSELFADLPEALENSVEISRRCTVEVQLGTYFLPDYPVPDGMTMDEFFRKASFEGLEMRLKPVLEGLDEHQSKEQRKLYEDRLSFELDIIIQMGFPGYFLIVMDFIRWSKANDIPVGPGRGSGAGSLVAYVLEITDLDPIPYDLLFERFLNPERVSMPDFDVDFCMDGRDRVIDYVAQTYGREAVSQIITFGTMAAKAVVRDVARVQGKSYGLADKLSKMIPFEVGMTLGKAIEQEATLKEFIETDEQAGEIWEMALKLEGVTRNVGKHAGGVVIAPSKLTDFAPLYCDEQGHGLVTQFDKNDVESAGLVKFDFLGLRTLTIVNWALETVNKVRALSDEPPLNIMEIDLEDKASFDLLKRAETTAVFQLESRGMKDLIKRLQPSSFEDIIALVALFRPGPLGSGMVDDFINRKHGREKLSYPHPDYQHDDLIPVLEPTYGIILYQEQVMQIAQVMAGFTLGGADLLRRAMGKKKPEEMAKQRELFMDGAKGRGVDEGLSGPIFDLMEKFAGYGFNKSHSAAYALVSFQTLWLKTHYPSAFMAAVLTADMQNTDKIVTLIEECREMKLVIVPPDVSGSEYRFTVNEQQEVVYGLGAIKGVGEGPIEAIQMARQQGGAFVDLFDFCKRLDGKKINKRVLEALIRSGAMDKLAPGGDLSLGQKRAILLASMEEAAKAADQSSKSLDSGHDDLFGELVAVGESNVYEKFMGVREWPDKERLKGEKDTLGIYLTGHPIDEYEKELRNFVRNRINDLKPARESQNLAGLIVASRVMRTKRGDKMAFITLDDRSGRIEVSLFADCYEEYQHLITKDTLVFVEGEVSFDDYSGALKVRAKRLMSLVDARQQYARFLCLELPESLCKNGFTQFLAQLFGDHPGTTPVQVNYRRDDARATLLLGESWRVEPSDELVQELRDHYGKDQVMLSYN